MKKRIMALAVALAAALPCPARAAEAASAGFSDVSPDAWYAPYVEVCAEAGVMRGIGDGLFAPEADLTYEESFVLLARLYDLLQGGDGVFRDPPPEAWGTARLTYEDGTSLLLNAGQMDAVGTHSGSWYTAALSPEDTAVAAAHLGQSATLTNLGTGESFSATCFFRPEWSDDPDLQIGGGYFPDFFASQYKEEWYGNALGYVLEQGLFDSAVSGLGGEAALVGHNWTIQRNFFASDLAGVAGELEKIDPAPSLSFLRRESHEDIYSLYEAGIMSQRDPTGDMDFNRFYSPITRAEAAVMVARVLEAGLRV